MEQDILEQLYFGRIVHGRTGMIRLLRWNNAVSRFIGIQSI